MTLFLHGSDAISFQRCYSLTSDLLPVSAIASDGSTIVDMHRTVAYDVFQLVFTVSVGHHMNKPHMTVRHTAVSSVVECPPSGICDLTIWAASAVLLT